MRLDDILMAGKDRDDEDVDLLTKVKPKTKRPPLYKVMLLNDDFTPMEFVVHVLERFFGLNHAQAFEIMLTVHKKGWLLLAYSATKSRKPKWPRSWISPGGISIRCNAPWKKKSSA